jgi:hypothetical protein
VRVRGIGRSRCIFYPGRRAEEVRGRWAIIRVYGPK